MRGALNTFRFLRKNWSFFLSIIDKNQGFSGRKKNVSEKVFTLRRWAPETFQKYQIRPRLTALVYRFLQPANFNPELPLHQKHKNLLIWWCLNKIVNILLVCSRLRLASSGLNWLIQSRIIFVYWIIIFFIRKLSKRICLCKIQKIVKKARAQPGFC